MYDSLVMTKLKGFGLKRKKIYKCIITQENVFIKLKENKTLIFKKGLLGNVLEEVK